MIQQIKWISEDDIEKMNKQGWRIIQVIETKEETVDSGLRHGSPFGETIYNHKKYYLCLIEL